MWPTHVGTAERLYRMGEVYVLAPAPERSMKSHRHYFACIRDAWSNLPEEMMERFPTEEHLRKWALIATGYRDQRMIAVDTPEQAVRIAAFFKPLDDYAVVVAKENVVMVLTAKSQTLKAMGKKVFQKSKDAVLGAIAGLIGISKEELMRNAGQAA